MLRLCDCIRRSESSQILSSSKIKYGAVTQDIVAPEHSHFLFVYNACMVIGMA